MKILIIEDSKPFCWAWQEIMSRSPFTGWQLKSSSPDEIADLGEMSVDIVICRGVPRHRTAQDLIDQVRSATSDRGCKIVICSTFDPKILSHHFRFAEVDALLPLPLTDEGVNGVLQRMCARLTVERREYPVAVVVDDSATVQAVLHQHLADLGFSVAGASNGEEGKALIEQQIPDIALVDIEMPVKDGLSLCFELSQSPLTDQVPVVIMSTVVDTNIVRQGFDNGAIHFLQKPFTPTSIAQIVRDITPGKQRIYDADALVLEDSPVVAMIIRKLLEELNVRCIVCKDIQALDAHLSVTVPDLITLDMTLPDGDGLDVCRRLRQNSSLVSTPIVFISGETDREVMILSLEQGANDYLIKPFERKEFFARIKNQLQIVQLRKELQQKVQLLEDLAYHDSTTGMFNRFVFDRELEKEAHRAEQNDRSLGLILLDIDINNPEQNENRPACRDQVLREVAQRINNNIRPYDVACRIGDRQLCVLLPGDDLTMTERRAKQILSEIRQHQFAASGPPVVRVGVSALPKPSDKTTLLRDTQQAVERGGDIGSHPVAVVTAPISAGAEKYRGSAD